MMEIKTETVSSDADMAKCVVATSLSALALRNAARERQETLSYPLYVPFVIGRGALASLYVTRLDENGKLGVDEVFSSLMTNQQGEIKLIAALAVLLNRMAKSVASIPLVYWKMDCEEFSREAKDHDNLGSAG